MSLYRSAGASTSTSPPTLTEFDILKEKHKFLREDGTEGTEQSWEDKLAQKYYESLYREYAVCDLKHYKSGNFSLRWRTEEEVISGAGENTCGNTRCHLHPSRNIDPDDPRLPLKTLELPFSYAEDGQSKFALVKVVLCDKCCKKLMWKRNKEKEQQREREEATAKAQGEDMAGESRTERVDSSTATSVPESRRRGGESRDTRRTDRSRSRSPRRRKDGEKRRRSPSFH